MGFPEQDLHIHAMAAFGTTLHAKGDLAGAAKELREALRLNPSDGDASEQLEEVNKKLKKRNTFTLTVLTRSAEKKSTPKR